jgi:hypothetical protein
MSASESSSIVEMYGSGWFPLVTADRRHFLAE